MSKKPRLLDLFCGAGGAAKGYSDAGFEVIGVDIEPQKHYPFAFVQADALTFSLDGFDVVHASPPCQEYSSSRFLRNATATAPRIREKLIGPIRERLERSGLIWVIENVPGAPLPDAIVLCGSMFDLPIRRHRQFASSHMLFAPGPCQHSDSCINVIGGKIRGYGSLRSQTLYHTAQGEIRRREAYFRSDIGQKAMDIDWMTRAEMSQAIPPTYTKWIGEQLLAIL